MSKGKRAQYTLEFKMRSYMKPLLLGLMLLVTATAASAEWTLVGSNNVFTLYVDKATIRRNGNLVKMWDLMDSRTVERSDGFSYLSSKIQWEYDCKEEKLRILAIIRFDGQMGSGNVVYQDSDNGDRWSPVSPGSSNEAGWKIACGKQ